MKILIARWLLMIRFKISFIRKKDFTGPRYNDSFCWTPHRNRAKGNGKLSIYIDNTHFIANFIFHRGNNLEWISIPICRARLVSLNTCRCQLCYCVHPRHETFSIIGLESLRISINLNFYFEVHTRNIFSPSIARSTKDISSAR